MSAKGVGGVVVIAEPAYIKHRVRIAELAQKARLPTVFQRRENVEAGGLLSYGPDLNDLTHQSALIAGRILRGARLLNCRWNSQRNSRWLSTQDRQKQLVSSFRQC